MNSIYRIYFLLPNFKRYGLPGKVLNKLLEMTLKRIFDRTVPSYLRRTQHKQGHGLNTQERETKFIVSLTSFPARIDQIWISIECLLRQTVKPDAIYLWLSEEQFPDRILPESLTDLQDRGLTIKFVGDDLKAHKKYFYAMQQHPDANIITVDDDLYFDRNMLKNVIETHNLRPGLIATNRAHKITFDKDNQMQPYKKWEHITTDSVPSHFIFQTGGCGTLYPPGALLETAFDKTLIKELCFYSDDIWLKVMCLLSDTKVVTGAVYNKDYLTVTTTQKKRLVRVNVLMGANDLQLKNLLGYFKLNLYNYKN